MPTKNDRKALNALRSSMAAVLGAVAPEQRPNIYHQIKNRAHTYNLRNAFGFDDIESLTASVLADTINETRQRIVSMRKQSWTKAGPFESRINKAAGRSAVEMKNALACVMPSRSHAANIVKIGKVTERIPTGEQLSPMRTFSVSPAYHHFTKKLGASVYRKWIILSGEPIANPFEGATVWALNAYDYKTDTTIQVFGGQCLGKFIARPTVQRCVNELRRIAGQAVYAAMRGEEEEED